MRPLPPAIIAALLLAGCGGGGGHTSPVTPATLATKAPALPAVAGAPKTAAGFNLVLHNNIKSPNAKVRKPQYISPGSGALVFSVTPASTGTTSSQTYDVSTGNTQAQGSAPTTSQPCVFDGGANSERVCTFYIAASTGSNHFVVQSYYDTSLTSLLSVGATSPDPTITLGAVTPVSIALDPIFNPFDLDDLGYGPTLTMAYDDGAAGRFPLNIATADVLDDDFPATTTEPFVDDVASLVSGTPPLDPLELDLFTSSSNLSLTSAAGCASNAQTVHPASPAEMINDALCYAGGDSAATQASIYIVLPSFGTLAQMTLVPVDVSAAPFAGTGADTITVSAQTATGNLVVDTSTAPDNCPSSVATLSAGPYPFSNAAIPAATVGLTPAVSITNGATCELGFTVLGVTAHRIFTYNAAAGSFTVTIP